MQGSAFSNSVCFEGNARARHLLHVHLARSSLVLARLRFCTFGIARVPAVSEAVVGAVLCLARSWSGNQIACERFPRRWRDGERLGGMMTDFYFTPEIHLVDGRIVRNIADAIGLLREHETRPGVDRRDE